MQDRDAAGPQVKAVVGRNPSLCAWEELREWMGEDVSRGLVKSTRAHA